MLRASLILILIKAVLSLSPGPAAAQTRLLMLDQAFCEWCDQWDAEVGVVYNRTEEGRRAPLLRSSIFDPLPEGISLDRKARYTPTFVLLKDGTEVGRIEGYPGEDFFYGMLQQLLERAGEPAD